MKMSSFSLLQGEDRGQMGKDCENTSALMKRDCGSWTSQVRKDREGISPMLTNILKVDAKRMVPDSFQ